MTTPGNTYTTFLPGPYTGAEALTENTAGVPGRAILITASVAGTVTLTMKGGSTCIVSVAVGDNLYEFSVSKATVGTATITKYQNLY